MKKKLLALLLSLCLVLGTFPMVTAVANELGSVEDFQGEGFTLSTSGDYPWIVEEKDGEIVLTATYGEEKNPLSTLAVTFSQNGVFGCSYSTATGDTRDTLLYSFEPMETTEDYNKAVNNGDKPSFSGNHDWTSLMVNVTEGRTLYFVFAKKTDGNTEGHVWLRDLSLSTGGFAVTVNSSDETYGTAVASATSVDADAADKNVTLTATANEGGRFYGWVEDGKFLSAEPEYTIEVQADRNITAWFGSSAQYAARVDGVFYTSAEDAIAAANSGTASAPAYVVLTNDASISNAVTLNPYTVMIIPYSDEDAYVDLRINTSDRPYSNGKAANPASTELTQQGDSVVYTLTIESGASLTVPDTAILSVGGIYSGGQPIGGQVCGDHSEINVKGELNVNGILSCNGYIYGSGELNAEGGTVYENFTVTDFNGGGIFVEDASKGLFPFTSYTVMGIQCETTFDADSYLKAYCALYVSGQIMQIPVEVVGGSEALIQIKSGTAVMQYDEAKTIPVKDLKGKTLADIGTLNIKLYGDGAIGSMKMTLGTLSFNTQQFECPLPYCITIEQVSGTLDVTAKLKIMPGSQLIIDEDATLNIGFGGSLNALVDSTSDSNNAYKYPTMDALMNEGYFPVAEVVVAGKLTAEDGSGLGGLVMVKEGGQVDVSEHADSSSLNSMNMLMYVTDEELTVGSPEFLSLMNTYSQAMAGDTDAYAQLMEKASSVEGGKTYVAENGTIVPDDYQEQAYHDTVTFVNYDYLEYITEHENSADGYVPLAEVTQERHTALSYPNEDPTGPTDEDYGYNYKHYAFTGWNRVIKNAMGYFTVETDDDSLLGSGEPILYSTLPEVNGDAVYMAVYEEEWLYYDYIFSFEDGVEDEDISVPEATTVTGGSIDFTAIARPARPGYTFTGWTFTNGDHTLAWTKGSVSTSDLYYNYGSVLPTDTIIWVAQWEKNETPAAGLKENNFLNKTAGNATITITDSVNGVFTVECAKACVVAVDNGDGTYTRLTATLDSGNRYSFTAPVGFADDISIVVAVKGDVNGDGEVNVLDETMLSRGLLESTHRRYLNLTELVAFVADTNEDGNLDVLDQTRLGRVNLEDTHKRYLPFRW